MVNDELQDVLPKLIGAAGNFETIVFGVILVLAAAGLARGHLAAHRPLRARSPHRRRRPTPPRCRRAPCRRAAQPVLTVRGLHRRFGGLVAVNDVGFTLAAGEIVGLIGPNGAGKSTTFNLLTGVDRPSAGEVDFLGRAAGGPGARRRSRGSASRAPSST